jgi:ribonuclease T2
MRVLSTAVCFLVVSLAVAALRMHGQQPGQPGQFDYYLLTLSWSPEFCHGHPNAPECGGHHGFMVHGLWPQYSNGTWPAGCQTSQPAPTDTSPVANIMPPDIIEHEWEKHGTCSGLSGNDYFALIRKVFDSIQIPSQFASPTSSFTMRPGALKNDFEKSNPGLSDQDMAIQLKSRRYLNAVEICLTKDNSPKPTACSNVEDIHGGTFIVPPVR